jgi:hypothetical protein
VIAVVDDDDDLIAVMVAVGNNYIEVDDYYCTDYNMVVDLHGNIE